MRMMDAKGLDCSISQIRNGLEWVNKNKNTHTWPGRRRKGTARFLHTYRYICITRTYVHMRLLPNVRVHPRLLIGSTTTRCEKRRVAACFSKFSHVYNLRDE